MVRLCQEIGAGQLASDCGTDWSLDLLLILHHRILLPTEGASDVLPVFPHDPGPDNDADHLHPGRQQQVRLLRGAGAVQAGSAGGHLPAGVQPGHVGHQHAGDQQGRFTSNSGKKLILLLVSIAWYT